MPFLSFCQKTTTPMKIWTEWQNVQNDKKNWLIFIALALCLFCHSVKKFQRVSAAFRVRTKFPVFILSKKLHAYEDKNRMTKWTEWQSFIWLIFTALALCLFCHSVKIKTPAGIKNKYALSVILSKNHHAYEDMNRMTKCAEWQKKLIDFHCVSFMFILSFCLNKSASFSAFQRENNFQFSTLNYLASSARE